MTSSSRAATFVLVAVLTPAAPLVSAVAEEGAPQAPELSKSEVKRYRAIMAEAVKAAKKGKHAQAIAAYDRALAIKPNDKAALTDQGWSAFLLGALDRAEAITRRAVAVEGDRRRSAAAYYNLGRILEKRGDKPGAIAAYVESLDCRPTRTVREQLAKLDPAKAAEMDPLRPVPMLGPFAQLEDFCKTPDQKDRKPCPVPGTGTHVKDLPAPYRDVAWFQAGDSLNGFGSGSPKCYVAFKLSQGWFIDANGDHCADNVEYEWKAVDLRVADLVPGGHPEVSFRTNTQAFELYVNDEGWNKRYPKDCESRMVACGIPAKGTPSCIYLQTGKANNCWSAGTTQWHWQLEPVFTADGQVEVQATGNPDGDARLFMGRRPLVFP